MDVPRGSAIGTTSSSSLEVMYGFYTTLLIIPLPTIAFYFVSLTQNHVIQLSKNIIEQIKKKKKKPQKTMKQNQLTDPYLLLPFIIWRSKFFVLCVFMDLPICFLPFWMLPSIVIEWLFSCSNTMSFTYFFYLCWLVSSIHWQHLYLARIHLGTYGPLSCKRIIYPL